MAKTIQRMSRYERALANVRRELAHIDTVPVYFAQAERTGEVKIGFSTNVSDRLYMLRWQRHTNMTLLGWVPGGPRVEREMHARFDDLSLGGEWFEPDPTLFDYVEKSTRHDEPPQVLSPFGRITDWGYNSLLSSEEHYSGLVLAGETGDD